MALSGQLKPLFTVTAPMSMVSWRSQVLSGPLKLGNIVLVPSAYGFFAITGFKWTTWWAFMPPLVLKRLPHTEHSNGFSPVWIRRCCISEWLSLISLWQNSHWNLLWVDVKLGGCGGLWCGNIGCSRPLTGIICEPMFTEKVVKSY